MSRQGDVEKKLKIALDETRMLITGVQILIGFQFQAIVQERFAELPFSSQMGIGVALVLMVATAGLLIAPAAQHRLVERGEATARIVGLTTRLVESALIVFALGLSFDLFVVFERIAWFEAAFLTAVVAFVLTWSVWYGFALIYRPLRLKPEHAVSDKEMRTPLSTKIDYMLTEARVILPGVQALLGFQLIAVLTKPFEALPGGLKVMHAASLALMTVSIILLLAPAAIHRLAFAGEDVAPVRASVDPRFFRARSSAEEHYLDMVGVTGSIPVAPTIISLFFLGSGSTRAPIACKSLRFSSDSAANGGAGSAPE